MEEGVKRLESLGDLERLGFDVLTGEACGVGNRLLVDLSPSATGIMEEFLSMRFRDDNNSWNHSGQAGWHSIMMPRDMIDDLLVHILAREGYPYVVKVDVPRGVGLGWSAHFVEGIKSEAWDAWKERAERLYQDGERYYWRVYRVMGNARNHTRNTHYFSGRTD